MTAEEAVRERLLATSAVTTIVSQRVRMILLRQGETLPAIRVQLISDPRTYHQRGVQGLERARVQVDVYAATNAEAEDLAAAADDALSGATFQTTDSPVSREVTGVFRMNRFPIYEPDELKQFRVLQDYDVWSRPL